MNRDHVKTVVVKHLVQAVDTLDPNKIDTAMSMKDMGANSLDIVEVVSAAMRELKIKVPRSELTDINNIDVVAPIVTAVLS